MAWPRWQRWLPVSWVAYSLTLPAVVRPLPPALQTPLFLTVHVGSAIVAYGTYAIAGAAAVAELLLGGRKAAWRGCRYPILLDPTLDTFYRWSPQFGLPRHYFVDARGTVVREIPGELPPEQMVVLLAELLGPPSRSP